MLINNLYCAITSETVLQAVCKIVETVGRYGGLLLLITSIIMFVLAAKDNDGPKHAQAKKLMLIAIASMCFGMLIDPIISGIQILINDFFVSVGVR